MYMVNKNYDNYYNIKIIKSEIRERDGYAYGWTCIYVVCIHDIK